MLASSKKLTKCTNTRLRNYSCSCQGWVDRGMGKWIQWSLVIHFKHVIILIIMLERMCLLHFCYICSCLTCHPSCLIAGKQKQKWWRRRRRNQRGDLYIIIKLLLWCLHVYIFLFLLWNRSTYFKHCLVEKWILFELL